MMGLYIQMNDSIPILKKKSINLFTLCYIRSFNAA